MEKNGDHCTINQVTLPAPEVMRRFKSCFGLMNFCFVFKYTHVLVSLLLLGRIRNKAEVDEAAVDAILSLNIISAKYLKSSHNSSRWGSPRSVLSQPWGPH